MKTITVVPAHNEEKHVGNVVEEALKYSEKVVVVDDGSDDMTALEARNAGAKVLKLSRQKGKGFAMRVGMKWALENGAEAVVFMDGDEQHRAEDIPKFVEKLRKADIVFGNRVSGEMPLVKKFGNWFLRNLFKTLFEEEPGDLLCGFKGVRKETAEKLEWKSDGYSVEIEIAAKVAKSDWKSDHVSIPIIYINKKKGTGVMDGIWIGFNILKFWLLG